MARHHQIHNHHRTVIHVMPHPVIIWFRQDLRISDHPALSAAAQAGPVIALYILDDDTPGDWRWGGASRWWLHHSLAALGQTLRLVLRRGPADRVIGEVLRESNASALYFTRDYAPWAGGLEERVKAACDELGAGCHRYGGFLLHEPEALKTGAGEPYKVYSPFARAALARGEVRSPKPRPKIVESEVKLRSDTLDDWGLLPTRPNWAKGFADVWTPGEAGALARLQGFIDQALKGYGSMRDRPGQAGTSRLSPHLHWGEISPVQVWTAVRSAMAEGQGRFDQDGEKFLKELLWREFSYHLLHHFPHLPKAPFKPEFGAFPWAPDEQQIEAWRRGRTGYPIVDAGMRELWITGSMHNRVRMIAASFLIKDLLVPWQAGMKWFWDTLVDADIANNSASWQWVAGSGADAAPYFRIFNPVLQGEKFDAEGAYIRRWVPELKAVPEGLIHRPWEAPADVLTSAGVVLGKTYPERIVDHGMARDRALAALKTIKASAA
jgi:deoxyribodipyrimidine photo-lyase